MAYKLLRNSNYIIRMADDACIPDDPANSDYQRYLAWVAEGNAPAPAGPEPVVIPQEVTMRQARLALLAAGKLALVNSAINAMPSPQKEAAQIEWEYSNTLKRDNTLVLALGPALSMSSSDIDALFTAANAL